MPNPQQIEQDLREYLEREPNLKRSDRVSYLLNIFNKHLVTSRTQHMINGLDVVGIVSGSKQQFYNQTLPMYITNRKMDSSELTTIAMIESMINYLNRHHLLNKTVEIDYTNSSLEALED